MEWVLFCAIGQGHLRLCRSRADVMQKRVNQQDTEDLETVPPSGRHRSYKDPLIFQDNRLTGDRART